MANLNDPPNQQGGGARTQLPRRSTVGADYLTTTQLFSQDEESQIQDLTNGADGLVEEQRIQRAFITAVNQYNKKDGRRITFSATADEEARAPEEGDEVDAPAPKSDDATDDDEDLDPASSVIRDILAGLDQGAAQFAAETQARPHYVYNLMGRLCAQLHLLKETNDLLHQSNARNKAAREQLVKAQAATQERLQEATQKITELTNSQEPDPQEESCATVQLAKMKGKNQWYVDTLKDKEKTVDSLNGQVADLMSDNDELLAETKRLKDELNAAKEDLVVASAARGRQASRSEQRAQSLSPYSKAHANTNMAPPPLPTGRQARSQHREQHRERSHSAVSQRYRREATVATVATNNSNVSSASVNLDPEASMAIKTDRSVKDPDKFEGKQGTFYQWLTALTLKLSTCTFRTEGDGLRYVQGFMGGPPWSLVAPRIPTVGNWGKPCPNPFTDVDSMMKLLAERYGEDNTAERAMTAMVSLRQDKQDFNVFYAKYQELQAYCPMADDKQEVHRLQGKLHSRFRNKLADGTDIASLKDLVSRCNRLQTQWESIDAEAATTRQPRSQSKNRGRKKDEDNTTAGALGARKTGSYKINLPASELPQEFRNLPPLTNELRQTMRDSGTCYKCRRQGHTGMQRDKCPLAILEDAYEKRTGKVNQVTVDNDAATEQSGNGEATR